MGEPVEERGGHLGVAEHVGPFAEGQVGRHDNGGLLVEPADHGEQQLSAGLGKGQVAEFVEHDEVHAEQVVGHATLPSGPRLGFEPVYEVDDVEEATACAVADAGPGDREGKMGLAGPCAADWPAPTERSRVYVSSSTA